MMTFKMASRVIAQLAYASTCALCSCRSQETASAMSRNPAPPISLNPEPPMNRAPPIIRISSDGRALEIKRASDAESVRVSVLDQCGDPAVGQPRIRHVREAEENIFATFGKHCEAMISLRALAIQCRGCG